MGLKPVILEGGSAEPRVQWLSDVISREPEERRIERSVPGTPCIIEVYIFTGDREPVVESWKTRGGQARHRTHQAPVFHLDHLREYYIDSRPE